MTYQKSLAMGLSIMLLLIMGTMYQSYASHATEHTHHHSPATHSAGVCSWMCAAAQTISGEAHFVSHGVKLIAHVEWSFPEFHSLISSIFLPARAPPR